MIRMKMLSARADVYILLIGSLCVSIWSNSGVVCQITSPASGQNTQKVTPIDGATTRTSAGTGFLHASSASGESAGATFTQNVQASDELWTKIRHKHQKVRLKMPNQDVQSDDPAYEADYADESELAVDTKERGAEKASTLGKVTSPTPTVKPFWIQIMSAAATKKTKSPDPVSLSDDAKSLSRSSASAQAKPLKREKGKQDKKFAENSAKTDAMTVLPESIRTRTLPGFNLFSASTTGAPKLENKLRAFGEVRWDASNEDGSQASEPIDSLELDDANGMFDSSLDDPSTYDQPRSDSDLVSKFLRVVESQHMLGDNCTAGTETTLGEGVVDRYAQERFRLQAEVAVNRANWLTRMWKYADNTVLNSEYLLHVNLYSIIEMDENIFAAGNCYDGHQYKDYALFCPFAYRLPEGPILAKDLAMEYKYLSNTSEWFYIARKNAERVISNMTSLTKGYHTRYIGNDTSQTERIEDEILYVSYEDGKWTKPYYDCGGGNIWMMTYTVPFFGYADGKYFFKGTSGIDIDLRRVDIDQCPPRAGSTQLNIFAASDRCKANTTRCMHIPGLGFRRGSYRCECKDGFYFPDKTSPVRYYNGTAIEEEYEKKLTGQENSYDEEGKFECLPCPEGCDVCVDDSPCIVTLNWGMRTTILILEIIVICGLPVVAIFTWRYSHIKVVRAASPALLRFIILGAFFIYCTILVAYTRPNMITCSLRVWLREIGFSFAYGALMLKTWRISIIFRVRSAKAVKITDLDLIKRLGIIVSIFAVFLSIRTIVGPPRVIVGKTADDLKAFICETDWWDHVFTAMEMVVLVWGIRLCIVVRKAPSEFNESRFISMAIYNEFLLSIFLNVSMLFLQSPANPDLLYIIMFSHTQLTTTLLLVLIFGSKAYLVLRGRGKGDENASAQKPQAAKFLTKPKTTNHSTATASVGSFRAEYIPELSSINDPDTQAEIRRILAELEQLRERAIRSGNAQFATRLAAMSQAARQVASPVTAIDVVDAVAPGAAGRLENGPSGAIKETENDLRQRKSSNATKEKNKSPKNSPDSGLGGLLFNTGPTVNNVLACMTDKIVCATFSADPALVTEENVEEVVTDESPTTTAAIQQKPGSPALAPVSSLALAAAPLLTSNFAFDTRGVTVLRNYSAPNSRRSSDLVPDAASSVGAQLSLVGNHANSGALVFGSEPTSLSVHSLCHLPSEQVNERRQSEVGFSPSGRRLKSKVHHRLHQYSPNAPLQIDQSPVNGAAEPDMAVADTPFTVDSSVHSAQVSDGVSLRSLSRSRINTGDRECFTDEMTV